MGVAEQPASQEGQEEAVGCGLQGPVLFAENPQIAVGATVVMMITLKKLDTIITDMSKK